MKPTSDPFEQEDTMRALQNRDPLRAKEEMIEKFKHYVNTYEPHMTMSPETFMRDMIYGIGRSMCDEYEFAVGYLKFIDRVKKLIEDDLPKIDPTLERKNED